MSHFANVSHALCALKRVNLVLLLFTAFVGIVFPQAPPPVSFQLKGAWNDPVNYYLFDLPGHSAVVGDFNLDGKLDVLTVAPELNVLNLLGNGDGSFQYGGGESVGGYFYSVASGDLRGDGTLILVEPGRDGATLDGPPAADGTFDGGGGNYGTLFWNCMVGHFATLGDFNKDGKLDVAFTFPAPYSDQCGGAPFLGNSVVVFLGNGDGTFGRPFPVGVNPQFLARGDFNGSGNPYSVAVFPVGVNPQFLAQGDFNGDGNLDLVVPNCAGQCGDSNGDGTLDSYVPGVSSISVLLGNGDGTFHNGVTYGWGASAWSIVVGDFNDDGKLDMAVSDRNGSNLGVFLGKGDGTFNAPVDYSAGLGHWNVVTADFNGDGKSDLAVCVDSEAAVSVLLGNGDGTFQSAVKYFIPFGAPSGGALLGPNGVCETLAVGDFSGDGRPEIAIFDDNQRLMELLLNTTTFANTAPGANVGVQPLDTNTSTNPVSLTFSNVTQAGVTTLTTSGTGGLPTPSGFQLGSPATQYKISTTSTFTGTVSVCISYAATSFNDQTNLRLFHFANGTWTDITTSVDSAHKTICGNTTSFSPFVVAQPIYSAQVQQPINADGSSVFNAKKGVVPVKFNLTAANVSTCSLPMATIALTRTLGSSPGVIDENLYEMSSDSGRYFRISSCQYVYNLSAQSLGAGSYRVDILIGSQVVGSGVFGLK